MAKEYVIGDWIVHEDGGLTHKVCESRVDHHRTDGQHFCGMGICYVPILVCELMKINRDFKKVKEDGKSSR